MPLFQASLRTNDWINSTTTKHLRFLNFNFRWNIASCSLMRSNNCNIFPNGAYFFCLIKFNNCIIFRWRNPWANIWCAKIICYNSIVISSSILNSIIHKNMLDTCFCSKIISGTIYQSKISEPVDIVN